MESFIAGLLGTGVGGTIVWLAIQKIIDDSVDGKLQAVWKAIDLVKQNFCSKEVCNVIHENVNRDNKRIEEALTRIEKKLDDTLILR